MRNQNYYEILGVSSTATQEEIKQAYKSKAIQYHPDNNHDANAKAIFQSITVAYEVLSDLPSRKKYDDKLRRENRVNTTTDSSLQSAESTQYSHYSSYTKTIEENESDNDDWLNEYLKRERKKPSYISDLDSLYKLKEEMMLYKKIKENIRSYR